MRTLDRRTLNRAALERQHLLERADMSALDAVRHLVALQAQENNVPYYTLWTRLAGFRRDDLTDLMTGRHVVRGSILRGTQHMALADDYLWLRPLVQESILRARQGAFGGATRDWDLDELAAAARGLLEGEVMTRPQLAGRLAEMWPGRDRTVIGWTVQALLSVVHPPPSGTWNVGGATPFALAEEWIGRPFHPAGPERLVRRYLAAFGPASVKDFQIWSGLRRMAEVFDGMRPDLRVCRDENGVELFDLPDARLPDGGGDAPVRFLPGFDNLVLAYADRTRLMTDEHRKLVCVGSETKPTLLVDGRVHGLWTLKHDRKARRAVLTVEAFAPIPDERAVEAEAASLLEFTDPDAAHEVRLPAWTG
ncbi:winged helix DNA-binding domain-containing protein [Actinomadura chibensis]|uniref:Winged helix DNA-binding domain-containing protein n=1 Tax=Actinomadura chibensis TaxID=392828 RepID=A0A5D0NTW9_9ACTN|nr:winged helix DNA-binding domain-containing protein [Actinomadura chibensis]TYB48093.1 winged helix DNA-binding domain-containing protein [Actinomadura chibensis]